MFKIYFICPWESSDDLLKKLMKNTPKNKGIWKNIIGTNRIHEADYIVILDDLSSYLLSQGIKHFIDITKNINKLIYFQRENTAILEKTKSWFRESILPNMIYNYNYEDNYFYTFTTAQFLNKTYDELKTMEYSEKTANISCIVSNKSGGHTYENRKNFIKIYSNKFLNAIDIYGKGWNNELGTNYKGELGSYHQDIDIKNQ